jgi:hypothetical protein
VWVVLKPFAADDQDRRQTDEVLWGLLPNCIAVNDMRRNSLLWRDIGDRTAGPEHP